MIVSIHQPQYLPWPGYFEKIDHSDVFVFLDDVQFTKNDWQNRNKIRTKEGWQWLTVPVLHKLGQKINETRIDERTPWRRKHLRAIELNYSRAPHYAEYAPEVARSIEPVGSENETLADVCIQFINAAMRKLRLRVQTVRSSTLDLPQGATERLVAICKHFKADTYYSGAHGRNYLDVSQFEKENIRVVFQEYATPPYPQCFEPFVPSLSIVDLLFNAGPRASEIVQSGGRGQRPGVGENR